MDSGGYRFGRGASDGIATLEAQAASHVDIADQTIAHMLYGFDRAAARSGIYAALNDLVVLAGGRNHLFGFEDIVRLRLLAIHVLARLDSPNGLQSVVVVRRSDGNRIDVFFLLEEL